MQVRTVVVACSPDLHEAQWTRKSSKKECSLRESRLFVSPALFLSFAIANPSFVPSNLPRHSPLDSPPCYGKLSDSAPTYRRALANLIRSNDNRLVELTMAPTQASRRPLNAYIVPAMFKNLSYKLSSALSSSEVPTLKNSEEFAKAQRTEQLFPSTDPKVDGDDCLHDCSSCTVNYPRKFEIDETEELFGHVKGWSTHLIVATGKTDWVRDVADEKGSIMEAVDRGGVTPSNGKLMLSASNMPVPDHSDHSTMVLLLPSWQYIDNVTPANIPDLITNFVNPGPTNNTPLRAAAPPPPPPATAAAVPRPPSLNTTGTSIHSIHASPPVKRVNGRNASSQSPTLSVTASKLKSTSVRACAEMKAAIWGAVEVLFDRVRVCKAGKRRGRGGCAGLVGECGWVGLSGRW